MQKATAIEEARKIFEYDENEEYAMIHIPTLEDLIKRLEKLPQELSYNQGCIDTLETHLAYENPIIEMQKSLDFLYSQILPNN